jgi:threonine/homoserine/homoserine lactone efflux protein
MAALVLQALSYGLFLAILVGPLFVTLVNAGMQKGIRAAMFIALGIWVSDVILVGALIKLSQTFSIKLSDEVTKVLGILSGLVFIVIGVGIWLKRNQLIDEKLTSNRKHLSLFTYGFVINTINPFAIIFWIGLVTNYMLIRKITLIEALVFFGIIMLCIIISDAAKVILSKTIKKYLSTHNIILFKAICGMLMVISGLSIIIRVIWL